MVALQADQKQKKRKKENGENQPISAPTDLTPDSVLQRNPGEDAPYQKNDMQLNKDMTRVHINFLLCWVLHRKFKKKLLICSANTTVGFTVVSYRQHSGR